MSISRGHGAKVAQGAGTGARDTRGFVCGSQGTRPVTKGRSLDLGLDRFMVQLPMQFRIRGDCAHPGAFSS